MATVNNLLASDFSAIQGLDLGTKIQELSFPVHKETLLAETAGVKVNRAVILRTVDNARLGLVSLDRPPQNHGATMQWFTDELAKTGVPFKLKNCAVSDKDLSLYQEYVMDFDVTPPDGEKINPMIILRSSFVGKPLSLNFGTYRFTCANGVTVGRTIDKIDLSAKEFGNFARMAMGDAIKRNLDAYKAIETLYARMADADLQPVLASVFGPNQIPIKAKKSALEKLELSGVLTVIKEGDTSDEESMVRRLRKTDFENIAEHAQFHSSATLWDVYNHLTSWASREPKSENTRMVSWRAIDQAFAVALAESA